jgi:hypothetical protein
VPLLPRFTDEPVVSDPLELALLAAEAREAQAREAVADGRTHSQGGDPDRLRGVPVIGPTVRGATPGSSPLGALIARESRRRRP